MAKLIQPGAAPAVFRSFDPIRFGGSSRLTFKRLRRPTRLPDIGSAGGLGHCLQRLSWLFGAR